MADEHDRTRTANDGKIRLVIHPEEIGRIRPHLQAERGILLAQQLGHLPAAAAGGNARKTAKRAHDPRTAHQSITDPLGNDRKSGLKPDIIGIARPADKAVADTAVDRRDHKFRFGTAAVYAQTKRFIASAKQLVDQNAELRGNANQGFQFRRGNPRFP